MFGLKYAHVEGIHAYVNLLLESHILHNMVTQLIVPRTGQRRDVTYMDLLLLTCILLRKSINPYIMLMCLIKMYSNPSLIYDNVFTKIFKKEGIGVESQSKKFKIRQSYNFYNEKNLRVM